MENEGTVGLMDLPETSGASLSLVLPIQYLCFPALQRAASLPSEVFQAGNIHSSVFLVSAKRWEHLGLKSLDLLFLILRAAQSMTGRDLLLCLHF